MSISANKSKVETSQVTSVWSGWLLPASLAGFHGVKSLEPSYFLIYTNNLYWWLFNGGLGAFSDDKCWSVLQITKCRHSIVRVGRNQKVNG